MATAKRLYLYVVSGVGLAMGILGAATLLRIFLNKIGFGPKTDVLAAKDELAQALAYLVAGLVIWLIHWAWVERMCAGKDDSAVAERRSIVRAVYFVTVLGISLFYAAYVLIDLASGVIGDMVKADKATSMYSTGMGDHSALVSTFLALGGVWAYHTWIRDRDVRQTTLISGAAAWVSRFYLYGAAFVGLVLGLSSVSDIIKTITGEWANIGGATSIDLGQISQISQISLPGNASTDWVRPVIISLTAVAVWGCIWVGHWLYSLRLRTGNGQQAGAERVSKVRLAFLVVVVAWGVGTVISGVASGLGELLAKIMDVGQSETPTWYLLFVPPIAAIPAAIAAWWYRERAVAEEPVALAGYSATRIILYVVALLGLEYLVAGGAAILQALVIQLFSPSAKGAPDLWKAPVAMGLGGAVVGGVFWVWPWLLAQARRAAAFVTETKSSSRAYYLYVALGFAVIALAVSVAEVLYHYSRIILSLDEKALANVVGPSLALGVVATCVLIFHAWVWQSDQVAPAKPAVAAAAAPTATAKPGAKAPAKPAAKAPAKKAPARKAPAKAK
jgi:hypothetical protein